MFLESSNRMNIIDKVKPIPDVSNAIANPIMRTSGKLKDKVCPERYTTIVNGNNPIKKLTKPAKADEIAKICGGI